MDLKAFDAFCKSLPATTMVVQWGDAHVWKVGGKVFALCGPWGEERPDQSWKIVFKTSDLAFQILTEQPGIVTAPYLGRFKWVQIQDENAMNKDDLKTYIKAAHEMVSKKLTRAKRTELGLI